MCAHFGVLLTFCSGYARAQRRERVTRKDDGSRRRPVLDTRERLGARASGAGVGPQRK